MRSILTLLVVCIALGCDGKNNIVVSDRKEIILISNGLLCFQDTSNEVNISDLLNKKHESDFKSLKNEINTFPLLTSQLWFKFEIINQSSENIFLEVGEPSVNNIELYKVNPAGSYTVKQVGYFSPYKDRDVKTNNYLLNLDLLRDSSALYFLRVRMKNKETITVPLAVKLSKNSHQIVYYFSNKLNNKIESELYLLYAIYRRKKQNSEHSLS